jgi:hypothetical protein
MNITDIFLVYVKYIYVNYIFLVVYMLYFVDHFLGSFVFWPLYCLSFHLQLVITLFDIFKHLLGFISIIFCDKLYSCTLIWFNVHKENICYIHVQLYCYLSIYKRFWIQVKMTENLNENLENIIVYKWCFYWCA